ncbi:hypothetical protein JTB14_015526 [Gonioctena quinquepunctata]|nr:hypothetical protein JTB14_015526 [Gonioctena quinquepunctata]
MYENLSASTRESRGKIRAVAGNLGTGNRYSTIRVARDSKSFKGRSPEPDEHRHPTRLVRMALAAAGVNISEFRPQSTRHAATSRAHRSGVSMDVICKTVGWTHSEYSRFRTGKIETLRRPVSSPDPPFALHVRIYSQVECCKYLHGFD